MGLVLVKLGGSLITDKEKPQTARPEVIERLAGEIAAAVPSLRDGLVLAHGSGSFGHVAAAAHGLHGGLSEPSRLLGVTETQDHAHRLHRLVMEKMIEAGLACFSLAPSSLMIAEDGRPAAVWAEPALRALELGLVPVTFGDVVLDRRRGVAIFSTETVLGALAAALEESGRAVGRALWMGATDGVLDARGETVPVITEEVLPAVREAATGATGEDVTGGMRHRVEAAWAMARAGIGSLILDGSRAGVLERALAGEQVGGTRVEPPRGANGS